MNKRLIVGGCSFTLGNELSDDMDGKTPSKKSWASLLADSSNLEYQCTAVGGIGNQAIARRVFNSVANNNIYNHQHTPEVGAVVVMWSFLSRYDWAMPRHRSLEDTRWASITPWDTTMADDERHQTLAGSEVQQEHWTQRQKAMRESGVSPFAESLYRYAANQYHEIYLSWKSIIWLQNLIEKKKIPFMFTLADNSLFYEDFNQHFIKDYLMRAMFREIDFTKWFGFGERMMGFNQWALLNDYPRGTTHPLDEAHQNAVKLMLPTFNKLIGRK